MSDLRVGTAGPPTFSSEIMGDGSATVAQDPRLPDIYRRIALRIIPFLFVCYLFNYIDRVNVGFAKLQMLDDLRMSETVYGLGAGIFFLGYLACGVPSNLILQQMGARRWIAAMMIAWGVFSTALILVKTRIEFYALRFLTGSAEAGFFPGIVFYLTRWFPKERHGRVLTIFMSAIPVSGIIGGPVSGWILGHFTRGQGGMAAWQWLYLLQGIPTVLLSIVVWFFLTDDLAGARWLNDKDRELVSAALAQDSRGDAAAFDGLSEVLRSPAIWVLGIIYFCIQCGVYAINFWLPTIIKTSGESDPFVIGMMSAIPYLAAAIFMVVMGRSADRWRERRWHLAGPLLIAAAGLVIAANSTSPTVSLSGLTLAAMGAIAGLPMFWPVPNNCLTAGTAAGGLALINSIGQIAGFVSPYLVGWIKDATGNTSLALVVLAIGMVVGSLLVLRFPASTANQ